MKTILGTTFLLVTAGHKYGYLNRMSPNNFHSETEDSGFESLVTVTSDSSSNSSRMVSPPPSVQPLSTRMIPASTPAMLQPLQSRHNHHLHSHHHHQYERANYQHFTRKWFITVQSLWLTTTFQTFLLNKCLVLDLCLNIHSNGYIYFIIETKSAERSHIDI